MKRIIIILLLGLLAGSTSADFSKVGSAGAQFLKIGVGSRYQGMSEASVAIVNDIYAMYWNPAGLVEIEDNAIGFTNVNWVLDIDLNYVAAAKYFEDIGVFGVSATVLSMDDQEITDFENQDGTGNYYSASSFAVGISFARQLTNKFAFGLTAKYIGEKIYNENSAGFAFDFGTMLYTGFRSLRLGMSITNLGMTFRVGLAYDLEIGANSIMTFSSELKHPNDNLEQGSLGVEYSMNNQFFLRSGYKFNTDEEGLAFGGGLITSITEDTRLFIDYSWQEFGRLESAQRFSIGFTF